jgi:hypothetical protein
MLYFYENKQVFFGHSLAEGMFVTKQSSNEGIISFMNCVGYKKLPFHEQYIFKEILLHTVPAFFTLLNRQRERERDRELLIS